MLLQKIRAEDGVIIEPAFDTDEVVFKHCVGGQLQVPSSEFTKSVKPLLHFHGLIDIHVKDRTMEKSSLAPLTSYHRNRKYNHDRKIRCGGFPSSLSDRLFDQLNSLTAHPLSLYSAIL